MSSKYITFKLDVDFVRNSIDPLVSREKGLGNRAAVIREAIRKYRNGKFSDCGSLSNNSPIMKSSKTKKEESR